MLPERDLSNWHEVFRPVLSLGGTLKPEQAAIGRDDIAGIRLSSSRMRFEASSALIRSRRLVGRQSPALAPHQIGPFTRRLERVPLPIPAHLDRASSGRSWAGQRTGRWTRR